MGTEGGTKRRTRSIARALGVVAAVWAGSAALLAQPAQANDMNRVVNAFLVVPDDEQRRVLASLATTLRTLRTYEQADLHGDDALTFSDFIFVAAPGAIADGQINPQAVGMLADGLKAHVLAQTAGNPTCFVNRVRDPQQRPITVAVFNVADGNGPELIHQCFTLAMWNHLKGTPDGADVADWRGMFIQLLTERRPPA